MYELIKTLYPIYRSITGEGVRKSLEIINEAVGGDLELKSLRSGTPVYDWVIPAEYNVRDAYIITPNGKKICEFKKHNLHLLGYSEPVHKKLSLMNFNLIFIATQTSQTLFLTQQATMKDAGDFA